VKAGGKNASRRFQRLLWCPENSIVTIIALDGHKRRCHGTAPRMGRSLSVHWKISHQRKGRTRGQDNFSLPIFSRLGDTHRRPRGKLAYNTLSYHNGSVWGLTITGLDRPGGLAKKLRVQDVGPGQISTWGWSMRAYVELHRPSGNLFCGTQRGVRGGTTHCTLGLLTPGLGAGGRGLFLVLQQDVEGNQPGRK